MSQSPRPSAFAKRRKLLDNVVPAISAPETEPLQDAEFDAAVTRPKPRARRKKVQKFEARVTDGQNTFNALVHNEVVRFKGSREVEQLDAKSVKVRLSYGSRCVITGKAWLWVRQGTISVYGALLTASSKRHNFCASSSSSLPVLTALSETVEFQLESHNVAVNLKPSSTPHVPHLDIELKSSMTFRIVDEDELVLPALDISALESASLETTSNGEHKLQNVQMHAASRILVCGKHSRSTAVGVTVLTNRLLGEQLKTGRSPGVAVLDLDHMSPLWSSPGTVSLVLVSQQLLSCVKVYNNREKSVDLLQSIWVSATDSTKFDELRDEPLSEMLQDDALAADIPIVVRGGSWIQHLAGERGARFVSLLGLRKTIFVDVARQSQIFESCKKLADLSGHEIDVHPISVATSVSSNAEHKASLQALFRGDEPWHSYDLSYFGSEKELDFVAVQGGVLRAIDVLEILTGALVAVVLVKGASEAWSKDELRVNLSEDSKGVGQHDPLPIASERQALGAVFLGLGIVESVDMLGGRISLTTTAHLQDISDIKRGHQELGLVLEKPSSDGRFSRDVFA